MDRKLRQIPEAPNKKKPSSLTNDPSRNTDLERGFMQFEQGGFSGASLRSDSQSLEKMERLGQAPVNPSSPELDVDLRAMLSKLSFLEDKIHQVQDTVRSIIGREGQFSVQPNELVAQQQLVTTDLTSIIIQLISTAGTLLSPMKNTLLPSNFSAGQQSGVTAAQAIASQSTISVNNTLQKNEELSLEENKAMYYHELLKDFSDCGGEAMETIPIEDHDVKDSEDGMDGEHLPPGSYEILQLEKEEILAPHTHFCTICGKGFKRDANLRMHMRGHGDEYKTPAALAKPTRDLSSEPVLIKRYSCPFLGCKRNKEHKKFQPLKTILCVKNHYKRSHCDKSYSCSRCNIKKFSVMADLKTHEKHCGRDKWLCSCGTTFSRKDKLFGHVALFQGHTPALHMEDQKVNGSSGQEPMKEAATGMGTIGYNFAGSSMDNASDIDIKGVDDDRGYFSPMNFDSCNFGGFDDFPRPAFDIPESSFSFLLPESCNFTRKNGDASSSDRFG